MNRQEAFVSTGEFSQKQTNTYFFDKVINLQFMYRNSKDGSKRAFTIRSDYEMITKPDGSYTFVRMPIKPDIRVQYKQLSTEVAIELYVHITNFRAVAASGATNQNFTQSDSEQAISEVYIEMGYFNQMPDFTNPFSGLTKDDYNNLLTNKSKGTKIIKGEIFAVYPTKLPPDGVTTFRMIIGTIENSIGSTFDEEDDNAKIADTISIKDYLYKYITQRCLKAGTPEDDIKKIRDRDGIMSDGEASKYGVKVYCSKGVLEAEDLKSPPVLGKYDSVTEAFENFQKHINPNIRFLPLPTGDYLARLQDENDVSAIRSADFLDFLGGDAAIKIPAIDSIELGAMANITCPFFGLINPFQEISFQNFFKLSNFVGYYLPNSSVTRFYPINCEIDFSTNGKENTVRLLCSTKGDKE